jgi:hypothetical protein
MTKGDKLTFTVEISTVGEPTQDDVDRIAHFLAVHLNRAFGAARATLYHEDRRYLFDPADADRGSVCLGGPERWEDPDGVSS